jgi:hypothetical protein
MTSVQWMIDELIKKHVGKVGNEYIEIFEKAKEMHKQEIIDAVGVGSQFDRDYLYGYHDKAEQYYHETFVSKGSDFKQFSLYEHKDTITSADTQVSKTFLESVPQQETLYTEEQMMGYAEWIFNLDTKTVLTMPKEALLQEYISQSLKQPKKD